MRIQTIKGFEGEGEPLCVSSIVGTVSQTTEIILRSVELWLEYLELCYHYQYVKQCLVNILLIWEALTTQSWRQLDGSD